MSRVWLYLPGSGTLLITNAKSYDFKNKRIGMIGGGSSGVQILPELVKIEGITLSCFVRSKAWIANPFFDETMEKLGLDPKILSCKFKSVAPRVDQYLYNV